MKSWFTIVHMDLTHGFNFFYILMGFAIFLGFLLFSSRTGESFFLI